MNSLMALALVFGIPIGIFIVSGLLDIAKHLRTIAFDIERLRVLAETNRR